MRGGLTTLLITALGLTISAQQRGAEPFAGVLDEHPVIGYRDRPARDRLAQLRQEIVSGARSLQYRASDGHLSAVLGALNVSPESQLLVFSKTGIQRATTSPQNPRALYFNDDVGVGYIAGAPMLELAAHDPEQGVLFYTIDQRDPRRGTDAAPSTPLIARRDNCLSCHVSGSTMEVPGMITRSMFTARNGEVIPQLGSRIVDHRTPLEQRWGGWFVTGSYVAPPYGGVSHMGTSRPTSIAFPAPRAHRTRC